MSFAKNYIWGEGSACHLQKLIQEGEGSACHLQNIQKGAGCACHLQKMIQEGEECACHLHKIMQEEGFAYHFRFAENYTIGGGIRMSSENWGSASSELSIYTHSHFKRDANYDVWKWQCSRQKYDSGLNVLKFGVYWGLWKRKCCFFLHTFIHLKRRVLVGGKPHVWNYLFRFVVEKIWTIYFSVLNRVDCTNHVVESLFE